MKKLHRDILNLIKSALTGQTVEVPYDLDIAEIYEISKKHQIIPLVLEGVYRAGVSADARFKSAAMKLVWFDQNQASALLQITNAFCENGIDYMLLKGSAIKAIYPKSEMRMMSDIDVLIKEEQYPKICEIMSSLGFDECMETDHEHLWQKAPQIAVELHKKLIPSYNDDYYAYYSDAWGKACRNAEKPHCFTMKPEDEYLFLLTHLTKHYRDGGIGIRQLVDMWVYLKKHIDMDMTYIRGELLKLELNRFYDNIVKTLAVWFDGEEENEITEYITERVIESGSYGIKERCDAANAARMSAVEQTVTAAKRKSVFELIFMPLSGMKKKYPILEKMPVLLPIMWVVRWLDAIFNKRKNIASQAARLGKINEQTVSDYNNELEMVGLKFDLK